MNTKTFINNAEEIIPSVNDSKYARLLVIGDVHAAYDKLTSLWQKLSVTDDDLVIFLGDYLYGLGNGKKNVDTLHWLIEHKKRKNIIFLRGNVDETYIHSLFDSNGNFFCKLNSKVAHAIKNTSFKEPSFPQEVYNFLTSLPLYYSFTIGGRKFFFCHAGIDTSAPLDNQKKSYLLDHPELKNFYQDYVGEAVIVVGHKSPKKMFNKLPNLFANSTAKLDVTKPLKVPRRNILMLDTGAKEDIEFLSCVDILTGELWQSDADNDAEPIDSILFVCSGNACRSPMAKYIMRHLLAKNGLSDKILVDSTGCNTYGGGSLSKGAREMLSKYHVPFDKHISKTFTVQEYSKFKHIIALDSRMLHQAKQISGGDPNKKINLFTDFNAHELNINDPFHTGDYEKAYEAIKLGCLALLKDILDK